MRYLFLLLIGSVIGLSTLWGQQVQNVEADLQWGDRQKAPSNTELAKIIDAGTWGAYLFRYRRGRSLSAEKYFIETYNREMDMVARFEFELPGGDGTDLEDIISLRGQLYLLLSQPDATGEISRLLMRPFSPRGQVIGQDIPLADIPSDEKYRRRQFDLEFNRDSSYFLIYNQLPGEREGPERFSLRVFDDAMQLQWQRDVELPFADEGFSVRSYQIDPEGNVYLLGRHQPGKDDLGTKPVHFVYAYTRNGQQQTQYELDIADAQLNQMLLRIAGNGDIVCAGFYGIMGQRTNLGICHMRFNPMTQEASRVDLLPFTDEFLSESTDEASRKQVSASQYYQLRDLTLRSDEGIVLVAEQYFRSNSAVNMQYGVGTNAIFHYNDIMVANIAPDGTYTWLRRIPKQQMTANDNGRHSSFAQATVQDRFLFLYNDHPDNFRTDRRRRGSFEEQNEVLAITEIRRSGEMATQPLFFNKDAGIITRPRRCIQISARQMLIYGEEERSYRLGLLSF